MATTNLEKLVVALEARTKEYERALARANNQTVKQMRAMEASTQGFAARWNKAMAGIGISAKAALTGAAVGAVAAFSVAVRNAVRDAAAIGDLADKVGLTTDAVQELAFGAVQADLGFEELSDGLLKFSKSVGEARNGSGDLLRILQANGFDQARIRAMSYQEVLSTVAELIKNTSNEQDAMLISLAAFGRGGADKFLEFLKDGKQGLDDWKRATTDAGNNIEDALVRKMQKIDDRWAALMQSMKTKTQQTVLFIADQIAKMGELPEVPAGMRMGRGRPGRASVLDELSGKPRIFPPAGSGGFTFPTFPKPTVLPSEPEKPDKPAKPAKDAIRDVIEALQFEAEQLRRTEVEQQVANELRRAGVSATSAQGQEIRRLVEANFAYEQSQRHIEDIQKQSIATTEDMTAAVAEQRQAIEDSLRALAELGLNAFERMAFGGERLKDVMADVAKTLASAALQAAVLGQGPLASLFGTAGGGIFGGLFGGGAITSLYHKGGVVGASTGMSRAVSPLAFAGAARMHGGGMVGLRSGEVPIIAQRGEIVLPRGASMGGSITVNYTINAANADGPGLAAVRAELIRTKKELPSIIKNTMAREHAQNPRTRT